MHFVFVSSLCCLCYLLFIFLRFRCDDAPLRSKNFFPLLANKVIANPRAA
jgi:hypothetical protein